MRSDAPSEGLDLDRDLPTTEADVRALRIFRGGGGSTDEFLRFLRQLGDAPPEALRKRRLPKGDEPFQLTPRTTAR